MLINWFTVLAEAINFLILVWLLKRFLYQPILHAIDERATGIAAQLVEAEATKADAQRERDDYRHKNETFDHDRTALLKKATDEAQVERQRLLDVARQDADVLRAKRRDALRIEQQNLSQEIIRRTQKEVFAISRKALTELAGTSLEERMSELFTRRLRELNKEATEGFAKALKTASDPTLVRSAFELPSVQRAAIQHALNETFSAEVPVRYETSPDVIAGIEFTANGCKVAWSIADFLTTLETSAGELLHEAGMADPKPDAKSAPPASLEAQPVPKIAAQPRPAAAAQAGPKRDPQPVLESVSLAPMAIH